MCGRFTLAQPTPVVQELLAPVRVTVALEPRYNIAPSQPVALLRLGEDGARELVAGTWGLLPSWVKDPKGSPRPINAKSETVAERPFFRSALRKRRCLIPVDGFYEWKTMAGSKQPFYLHMQDGGLFALAGLWEHWAGKEAAVETCTILTTAPNAVCKQIHHRMPVILAPEDYEAWLAPETRTDQACALLQPFAADRMEAYAVSTYVNNSRHEDARCLARGNA